MGNPSATITISLVAATEAAQAKLNAFFTKIKADLAAGNMQVTYLSSQATAVAARRLALLENQAKKTGVAFGGMSYFFRSAIDAIRYAQAGGGARAGFYALDEAVRGLAYSGTLAKFSLKALASETLASIPLLGIAWSYYVGINYELSRTPSEALVKQNEQLGEQVKWLEMIQKLRESGALSAGQAARASDRNAGSIEEMMGQGLIVPGKEGMQMGVLGGAKIELSEVFDELHKLGQTDEVAKKLDEIDDKFRSLKDRAEIAGQTWVKAGKMTQDAFDAMLRGIDDQHQKALQGVLDENRLRVQLQREKDAQDQRVEGERIAADAVRKENENLERDLNASAAAQGKTREDIYQQEFQKRMFLLTQQYFSGEIDDEQYTHAVEEATTRRLEGYKREQEELKKLAALKAQMAQRDFESERRGIEQNALLTSSQRNQQLQSLNASEILGVGSQLAQNVQTKPQSAEQQIQLLEQRKQLQTQLNGLLLEQQKLQQEAGTSFVQSFGAMFAQLQSKAQITFNTLAETFSNVFSSAINTVSQAITGLIMGTETWRQALMKVGESILENVVHAVVSMAVRWIATQMMMAVAGKAIMAAATASTIPLAAASAAIWSTPATLATIATYGAAALSAPGFIALASGLTMADSLSSFAEGGFTGHGPSDEVAGLVHRGEFVVPAERVNQLGLGFLHKIGNGDFSMGMAPSLSARGSGGNGAEGVTVNHKTELSLATFGGEADAKRWAESQEGDIWFLNQMNKHAYKYTQSP